MKTYTIAFAIIFGLTSVFIAYRYGEYKATEKMQSKAIEEALKRSLSKGRNDIEFLVEIKDMMKAGETTKSTVLAKLDKQINHISIAVEMIEGQISNK